MKNKKQNIENKVITGSIKELSKYLNMDETAVLMIYDYKQRTSLDELKEIEEKEGVKKYKVTDKSKTI